MTTLRKGPSPLSQTDEVWNLLYRFLRHWPLVVVVSLIGVAGGYLYGQRYRPVFHSEAQVRVGDELDARSVPGQREDSSEMMDLPDNLATAFRARVLVDAKLKPMVAELMRRPALSHLAELATTDGQEELIDHIKRLAQVDAVTRRVYRISYDAKDPDLAQQVVQGMAEIGVADVIAQRNQSAERARIFLTSETDRARQRMIDAETEVVQFVQSHPKLLVTMSGADRSKLGLQAADKLLVSARSRKSPPPLKALEASSSPQVQALLAERAQQEATVAQVEAAQRFDPLQQKLGEIDRLQQQLADLKTQHYTPEYPEYRRIAGEMERVQKELREVRGRRDPKVAEEMMAMDAAKSKIAAIDKEVASLRRRALGGGSALAADDQVLSAEAVYARLYRELETARAAYEKLRERELDAQINEQLAKVKGNPAARVEDPATRPGGPRGVSRKMMIALCVALGLLAGILAGAGRALTDPRIYTVFDLSRSSRLPVLGRLPPSDQAAGWTALDLPEVVLPPPESPPAVTRGYEGRIVWPRPVLTLPSSSSVAKLPAQASVLSAMSAASSSDSTASRKSPSRKSPPSRKTPPSGEYLIVPREPPSGASSSPAPVSTALIPSNQASQESAIVKWRAAASQKSGALHLSGLGYQVRLGELPKPPPPHLVLLSAPDGERAEQYRLLRLRLQEQGDPRVMVITSSRPGEGKTLCSVNLALAYAEGGGPKVVLVDTHMNSAQLSALLGVPAPGRGAADEALEHNDLRSGSPEVWQYSPNLFLVPASALGNKAQRTAILSSPEFAGLLADLREAFDYVIIDVPAISEAADAKLVLRHADAGILLVRAQKTTSSVVSTALDRIGRNTVSGTVLNVFN